MQQLEVDYLVIGAGAMGMAFSDVILNETDATVLIVDKNDRPGGHWNVSYPFVRLHQPSAFYGVNSRQLGSGTIDARGWNKGLYELASGTEVVTYFDQILQQQFLPSGRVQYFPMCEYTGNSGFRSLVTGRDYQVKVNRKIVDATYMQVTVPSIRPPNYSVAPGVACVPVNELPARHASGQHYDDYTIIGAGKTGMDACLWLLKSGVSPDSIRWIMPRDSWMFDRKNIQPGRDFLLTAVGAEANQAEAIAGATSIEDMFDRLSDCGYLLRLSDQVSPTMWRCATVTEQELAQLRQISNVVRLGHVQSITTDSLVLERDTLANTHNALFVDCSADGLERRPPVPVFADDLITLQPVRTCQQVFSAAFIAHVEATYNDEATRNDLCQVVPHPDSDGDFVRSSLQNNLNAVRWSEDPELQAWLMHARLDGFSRSPEELASLTEEEMSVISRMLSNAPDVLEKLQNFMMEMDSEGVLTS